MNCLVTGVAGDIGHGVGRILRSSDFVGKLIGCDIHSDHMGDLLFDRCKVVPRAGSCDYVKALESLVERERLDAIVPTSEPELRIFAELTQKEETSRLPLVMANAEAMHVGFDKLKTAQFIDSIGAVAPWTIPIEKGDPKKFPCVLKGRFGAGNQGVFVVQDAKRIDSYRTIFTDHVWQEYIPDENSEYTCGVYGCMNGEIRTIIFRRRLVSGITGYAELVKNKEIDALCTKVGSALNLRGSINVQLRLKGGIPMVFEINPRFSSTVVYRHKLGFTDLVWSLQEQILGQDTVCSIPYPVGTRVYRTFRETVR